MDKTIKKVDNSICPLVEAACCITAGKGYDIDNSTIWVRWVKEHIKKRIKAGGE